MLVKIRYDYAPWLLPHLFSILSNLYPPRQFCEKGQKYGVFTFLMPLLQFFFLLIPSLRNRLPLLSLNKTTAYPFSPPTPSLSLNFYRISISPQGRHSTFRSSDISFASSNSSTFLLLHLLQDSNLFTPYRRGSSDISFASSNFILPPTSPPTGYPSLHRGGMVQTGEQYEFIHRAVALYAASLPSPRHSTLGRQSITSASSLAPSLGPSLVLPMPSSPTDGSRR